MSNHLPAPEALKRLIEQWRKKKAEQWRWADDCEAKQDGANAHTCRGRGRIYGECADDLQRLLDTAALQGEDAAHFTEAHGLVRAQYQELLSSCIKTLDDNGHLADGDDCTLIDLKRATAKAQAFLDATGPPAIGAWQDIATAPKDGTWILAWDYDCGFYTWHTFPGAIQGGDPEPTHWMPLPSPPQAALDATGRDPLEKTGKTGTSGPISASPENGQAGRDPQGEDVTGREWVVIRVDGITVAQGYKCEQCGVIGCKRCELAVKQ